MAQKSARAAQYIRMSTEHQRFSPGHQAAAIAAYAEANGFELVVTYADLGISGTTIKARRGLQGLLTDVASGQAQYSTILVYDVSRWGRFQDPDQAAHYEFICREAGIGVEYCAEAFENDGSASATIMKLLKRVMAAEYSRDLSVKVARAHLRLAAKGLFQGGVAGYGLRRLLIDSDGRPVLRLEAGARSSLRDHRVVLVQGPAAEVAVVRTIFDLFLRRRLSRAKIASYLNQRGIAFSGGRPWQDDAVTRVLTNERYTGGYVYNRTSKRLGRSWSRNEPAEWVRVEGVVRPIIPRERFDRVQRLVRRARHRSTQELLDGLRALHAEHGHLTYRLIDESDLTASCATYAKHFGSVVAAAALVDVPKAKKRVFERDELIEALKQLHTQHGRLSVRILKRIDGAPSECALRRHFGSASAAFKAAGIAPSTSPPRHSDEFLLKCARGILRKHGRLSKTLIESDDLAPTYMTYLRRFGTLSEATERCLATRRPAAEATT